MFRRGFPLMILNAESDKGLSGRKGKMTRIEESSGAISIALKHQTPPLTFSWPGINVYGKDLPIILTNLFLASLWKLW